MKIVDYIKKYLTTFLVLSTILYLSLARFSPSDSVLRNIPNIDKFVHFCMYFGLVMVFSFDLYRQQIKPKKQLSILLSGWIFAIIISGLIEFAQAFLTTYRGGNWFDFLANSIGATAGLFTGIYLIRPLIGKWIDRKH